MEIKVRLILKITRISAVPHNLRALHKWKRQYYSLYYLSGYYFYSIQMFLQKHQLHSIIDVTRQVPMVPFLMKHLALNYNHLLIYQRSSHFQYNHLLTVTFLLQGFWFWCKNSKALASNLLNLDILIV
ncbi:hypothetical protein IIQ_05503 [Bacillus cereus VD118]|uniref:Uncharacterized protein n=2 Tax=Bacillus cereus group TaxID=86661 RepID=R8QXU5_BACCE|nr:hypothetical protein IEM_05458 [Bacillus cereus BAG6O-2]EOP75654.1 hypothetical protein IIQ_05503 [Bacillus cereus VD118]OFD94434.1 hypothetical protein BWGOE11_26350 [Bacillus mycoides]OFE01041.1 hypothetical protein BWGOE13_24990 [Bacillus mycoides]OHX31591.1 hypothetical protein BWGOE5_24660 [Bacillus mycoides]